MSEEIYIPSLDQIINQAFDTTLNTSDINLEDTKTYQWSGAKLTQQVGIAVPLVYGRHVLSGNLLNAYIEEGENETLNLLIGLCEGEIESITNVKINGTPIEAYFGNNPVDPYGKSAEVSVRYGKLNQIPIDGFHDLHQYAPIETVLQQSINFNYTTALTDAEAFTLEFHFDQLFQLDSDQNQIAWYVSFQVEYKLTADIEWTFMGVYEINKKTTSLFKRYVKSEYLPAGQYDIRVRKVSSDEDGLVYFGKLTLVSIDEIRTENIAYVGTACMGLRILAFQNLQDSLSNVSCLVTGKLVRVPKVVYTPLGDDLVPWDDYYWDAEELPNGRFKTRHNDAVVNWDGVSYVEAWSGNPVWCFRDLLLNERYGLGDFIKEEDLDEASFLASALYCEEGSDDTKGRKEKRFILDIVLDTDFKANDAIALMLKSFRGLLDVSNGVVRINIEKQEAPVYLFTVGNIIADTFSIDYLTNKVPNILSVSFTNKDKNYQMDSVEVADESSIERGENIRQSSLQLVGCTRISQVLREANIQIKKYKLNTVVISFTAYLDAVLLQPNDVFNFQHEFPAWGVGGRVPTGSTTTVVKLGQEVVIEAGNTYELMVKSGVDDLIETRTVIDLAGTYTELTVGTPFSFTPSDYDVWAFGIVEQSIQQYRAIGVNKSPNGAVQIQAINYDADVYDPTAILVPDDGYVHLSLDIPDVNELNLRELTARGGDGTIQSRIEVSFNKPITSSKWVKQAKSFEIHLSDNDGRSWNYIGVTDGQFFVIPEPVSQGQLYYVAVVSVAENGERNLPSNSPRRSVLIQGWTQPPSNVTGLQYTFTDEIDFIWDLNPSPDVKGYEIRLNDTGFGQNDENLVWRGDATKYTFIRPTERSGTPFYVRAFNSSEIYSSSSAIVSPINPAPLSPVLTYTNLFQKVFLFWNDLTDADLVHYEVWQNDNEGFSGAEGEGVDASNESLVHKATGTSVVLPVPYDTTYFRIRGVDKFGGGGWSNVVSVSSELLGSADIGDEIIRANHILTGSISAQHIVTGSLTGDLIAANTILAENLCISNLSGLSADLGCINAGCIIGACIRTSADVFRTELDQTGIYSYDEAGLLRVKITKGEACFIDPLCSQYYSFIDSGQIKFHTPEGDIPYIKRLCQGFGVAGDTIALQYWRTEPNVLVSLKRLTAYNSNNPASCQEWCVYSDNLRCYTNSPTDFGWAFDVHAKLVISGGTNPLCIFNIPFNSIRCTAPSICEVLVREQFQLWCNSAVPSNFQYGVECLEVKYRVQGCGVWCAECFLYTQPHSTVENLLKTYDFCQTINFGCTDAWEVELNRVSLAWVDSGLSAGIVCCFLCCFSYNADCSYCVSETKFASGSVNFCCCCYVPSFQGTQTNTQNYSINFPAFSGAVISSTLTYQMVGYVNAFCTFPSNVGGQIVCHYGPLGGGACVNGIQCKSFNNSGSTVFGSYQNSFGSFSTFTSIRCSTHRFCIVDNINACQVVCHKICSIQQAFCCFYYCQSFGNPAVCTYEKFYAMREVEGTECVLDPSGEISYLAVAYS